MYYSPPPPSKLHKPHPNPKHLYNLNFFGQAYVINELLGSGFTYKGWLKRYLQPDVDADLVAVKALRKMLEVHSTVFLPKRHLAHTKCLRNASETATFFRNGYVSELLPTEVSNFRNVLTISEAFRRPLFRLLTVIFSETYRLGSTKRSV